jgi:hypothetical protein
MGVAFVKHIAGKTTGAIAALLNLDSIGVVDDVFKVYRSVGRRTDRKYLISTDAKMTIRQPAVLGG